MEVVEVQVEEIQIIFSPQRPAYSEEEYLVKAIVEEVQIIVQV